MAEIRVHPSAIEDDSEEVLAGIIDFYVRIGLVEEGSVFVPDESMPSADDDDDHAEKLFAASAKSACHTTCWAAYEVATIACNLIPISSLRRKCRRKAEAAFHVCIAACDLVS